MYNKKSIIALILLSSSITDASSPTCESTMQRLDNKPSLKVIIPTPRFTQRLRDAKIADDQELITGITNFLKRNLDNENFTDEQLDLRETLPGQVIFMGLNIMVEYLQRVNTSEDFILLVEHIAGYDNYRNNLREGSFNSLFYTLIDLEAVSNFFKLKPSENEQMKFLKATQRWGSPEVIKESAHLIIQTPQTPELFIKAVKILENIVQSDVTHLLNSTNPETKEEMDILYSINKSEGFLKDNLDKFFKLNPPIKQKLELMGIVGSYILKQNLLKRIVEQVNTPEQFIEIAESIVETSEELLQPHLADTFFRSNPTIDHGIALIKNLKAGELKQVIFNGMLERTSDSEQRKDLTTAFNLPYFSDQVILKLDGHRVDNDTIRGLTDRQFQLWVHYKGNIRWVTDEMLEGRTIDDNLIRELNTSFALKTIRNLDDRQFQLWVHYKGNIRWVTDEMLEGRTIDDNLIRELNTSFALKTIRNLDDRQFQLWVHHKSNIRWATDEMLEGRTIDDNLIRELNTSFALKTIRNLDDRQFQLWVHHKSNIRWATDEMMEGRTIDDNLIRELNTSFALKTIRNLDDRQFQLWVHHKSNIRWATDEMMEGRTIDNSIVHRLSPEYAPETIQKLDDTQFETWLDQNSSEVTDQILKNRITTETS